MMMMNPVKLAGSAVITLKAAPAGEDPVDPAALAFDTDVDLGATVFSYVVGEAIDALELPDVKGGADGDKTYVTSALPIGLEFDAATQAISGTPTAVTEETNVVYTVIDSVRAFVVMTVKIEVLAAPPPTVAVDKVTATQTSIRENGETTVISITATLAEPAPVAGRINFTLGNATGGGKQAARDVDYIASLPIGGTVIEVGDTQASSTLTLTPINNDATDGNRAFGVHATGSGGAESVDITIADDETASTSISLSASPYSLSEDAGVSEVTVTATLDGKVLDADASVLVDIDEVASQATRDVDYSVLYKVTLTIPAGEVSGSLTMLIDPNTDDEEEGNETIELTGAIADLTNGTGQIIITDVAAMMDDGTPVIDPLAFAEGTMIEAVGVTAGSPMSAVVLPEAEGVGDIAYSVSDLPAGLAFDDSTRTLSGIPTEAASTEVTYTATAGEESVTLTFTITVNPPLSFGDLFGLFNNGGAGKANPASGTVWRVVLLHHSSLARRYSR